MGNKDFMPFALPDIGQDEIDEVVDSLQSGWLTTGPKTRQFEKEFAHYLGDNIQALAVNSATAGLHLALEAIGIKPGDEVITTTYTFTSTAEVIRYLGAHPVFIDVDPKTLNIDVKRVEHAITSRTKAIIPVHIAGLPCDMDSILSIAHKHNLKVVEDAAHAFPVHYREKYIGTLSSDVTVFSFYATKTITTGEGGMVVTANPEIAKRCSIMRLHGIDRDAFDRYTSEKPSWYYEIIAPGFKYNMTDIAASIGIHQLKKAHAFKEKRTAIAKRYAEAFKDLPVTLPVMPQTKEDHAWHLFILRLTENAPLSRNEFIQKMSEAGIGCSVHFIPLHMHPYWQKTYQLREEDYPIATRAYKGAVSLPIYTKMTDKDVDKVIKTVRSLLKP
ncbi:DegT/DnrJ/EryC1/StrS family aminotransferase [Aminobacterium sp. UBA5514]|uniref:DegT/DnrJ/EryC1/StrS family aminotransferase n=1 Tax=Aminobacterium sp. UBA5514 TaxID=1946036 RepID=UPI00257B850E|nr:DegT/DnrJ/EryC1/StrS family aminotransferase [Aminobacterium sp. UBA5514]